MKNEEINWIWQWPDFPNFRYWVNRTTGQEKDYKFNVRKLKAKLLALSSEQQIDLIVGIRTEEAVATSKIESVKVNKAQVKRAFGEKYGIKDKSKTPIGKQEQNIVDMTYSLNHNFPYKLTEDEICKAHWFLMRDDPNLKNIGAYRDCYIRVGSETHTAYEGPPAKRVPSDMKQFVEYFNDGRGNYPLITAAINHLHFECIHPFEDGNGRIGRAIIERSLRSYDNVARILSISSLIAKTRESHMRYYNELSRCSNDIMVTDWIEYFGDLALEATEVASDRIDQVR